MSFFSNIVKNVKEFYSEINAATLTGAIDVIVIQGEDGSFRSSPFHVRFGKLGVLKAREKIVDLEINGEPVSIQMKLDDNGAAFFVEEVEDDDWSPDLATSPIPSTSGWEFREKELQSQAQGGVKVEPPTLSEPPSITLQQEQTTDTCCEEEKEEGKRGKLNKKKRRRRNQLKHGRKGSKSSLKEVTLESEQDMFPMDDVNDADQEEEDFNMTDNEWIKSVDPSSSGAWNNNNNTKGRGSRMPRNFSLEFANSFALGPGCSTPNTSTGNSTPLNLGSTPVTETDPLASSAPLASQFPNLCEELNIENSLIGSRVPLIPKSSSEAETLEAILNDNMPEIEIHRPKSVSASFHYFSDTDAENQSPPLGSRPPSPGVTSDSEIEKGAREEQTSWRWGELPSPYQNVVSQVTEEEEKREMEREGSLLDWFRKDKKNQEEKKTEDAKGMYLDDLISGQVDPQTAAIYLSPSLLHTNDAVDNSNLQDPLLVAEESRDSILPDSDVQEDDTSIVAVDDNLAVAEIKKEIITAAEEEEGTMATVDEASAAGLMVDVHQHEDDCESGHGPSLPMSPQSGIITQAVRSRNFNSDSEDDFPGIVSRHIPDFALSLCGGLLSEKGITPDEFNAKYISHSDFVARLREDKDLLSNPNLVVRVNEKYTTWTAAAPIVLSILLYKEPLPSDLAADLTKEGLSVNLSLEAKDAKEDKDKREKKVSSWFTWFGSSTNTSAEAKLEKDAQPIKIKDEVVEPAEDQVPVVEEEVKPAPAAAPQAKEAELSSSEGELDGRRCRKTLRLNSDKLKELNLKFGSNEVQFSVTTAFQGTTRCKCHIYLWKHTDKVVISDIDGTITKSDVLGHILPVIGRDWAQSGVAQLFTKIRNNGYHIMYLSARAIGQASITKDYLQSVKQGDVCLPDGPLFLNPESLIHAFRKEVIDRNPEEFKIRCLKDIQSLFEGRNPFFAGYGNRPNDAYAYRAVGIPVSRIFTINPAGELRHELTQNFQTSYVYQSQIADMFFPPVGKDGFNPDFKIQDYSDFGYWREPIPDVETPQEENPPK